MLKNKESKKKRKEVEKIEAQWSKAQHDVIKSKKAISNSKADILAREQTKNKAMSLCAETMVDSPSTKLQFHLKSN